jgi:hypothetical protein
MATFIMEIAEYFLALKETMHFDVDYIDSPEHNHFLLPCSNLQQINAICISILCFTDFLIEMA